MSPGNGREEEEVKDSVHHEHKEYQLHDRAEQAGIPVGQEHGDDENREIYHGLRKKR